MDKTERKLLRCVRFLTFLLILVLAVLLLLSYTLVGTIRSLSEPGAEAARLSEHLSELGEKLDEPEMRSAVTALARLSEELSEADLASLSSNMNTLAVDARQSLALADDAIKTAVLTLERLDVEGLNTAVSELRAVVEPLAALAARLQ